MEKNNDLPDNWIEIKLDDICDLVSGKAFKKSEYSAQGVRLLQIANVSFGKIIWDNIAYLPNEYLEKHPELELKEGDIILALNRPIIRRQIKVGLLSSNDIPSILYQRVGKFVLSNNIIPKFIYYYFQSSMFITQLESSLQGIDIPFINKSKLMNFLTPLPSIKEQKRIVNKIEELFSLIDHLKQIFEKTKISLKEYRQSVLKSAFDGSLTINWRDNNDEISVEKDIQNQIFYKLENTKGKYQEHGTLYGNHLFKIPANWIWARFENIAQIGQGGTPSTQIQEYWNGNIPWLRSGDVKNNLIQNSDNFVTKLGVENSSTTICPKGTVLLAMTGQGLTRGRSAILEIDACANQSVSHIILNEQYVLNKFLFYYLQAKYWKIRSIYKGSNQPGLNVSLIKQFDIPIPLIPEQKIIIQKIEVILSLIDNNEKLILRLLKKIERIKISILKQAFEGKLVPQDPNDEPVSELLKRIKLEN